MAIYHPENLLITCGRDKLLKVYDLRTEKIVRSMRGHTNTVSQVVTNPYHKMVSLNISFKVLVDFFLTQMSLNLKIKS